MNFNTLGLVSVGIVVAAIGILGFTVYLNGRKSVTNRTFYIFSLITIAYTFFSYISATIMSSSIGLELIRVSIAIAAWHAFFIFRLLYAFPEEKVKFPKWHSWFLLPATTVISLLCLTPFVFSGVGKTSASHQVITTTNGPGIIFFGLLVIGLISAGLVILARKTVRAEASRKSQFRYVLLGTTFTFILLITFSFIFPAFLGDSSFIPYGPLFFFPFIVFTFYAITRHGLLNVKLISTEIIAFVLSVATLLQIVISQSFLELLLRAGVFILVLIFSFFLIQSVQREVEQREQLEKLDKELEEKNAQLNDLSRFKSELLSLASHQIRSPLAAVKGFAALILDGSYGPVSDKVKETVTKMKQSVEGLIGLINTLLDVRKVEEGKMEYQFVKTDLVKIVTDVVTLLQPLAEQKKLEFKFDSPGHEVFVNADGEKLKQVIQNLTDNAIKYTPSGFVHVALKAENGTVTVSVADSGLGVPASLVPHLFEEFIRDERVKKEILGTGLGLYIARKIAEAHGGKIWAESPGEGKGSTFNVSVPEVR